MGFFRFQDSKEKAMVDFLKSQLKGLFVMHVSTKNGHLGGWLNDPTALVLTTSSFHGTGVGAVLIDYPPMERK